MNEYDEKYEHLTKKMITFAKESNDIRAIFIVGSKTRDSEYNDRWSDIDYIVFTRKKEKYLNNENWILKFGNPLTKIKQSTVGKDLEWSVSFDNGVDADFVFTSNWANTFIIKSILFLTQFLKKKFDNVLFQLNMGASLFRSGYICIYDLDNVENVVKELLRIEPHKEEVTSKYIESHNIHFWHYLERVTRKYKRGEYYIVRTGINDLIHNYVLKLIEIDEQCKNNGTNTWYGGKLFETWSNPKTIELINNIYTMGTQENLKQSIITMVKLYQDLFERIYKHYRFTFNYDDSVKLKSIILDAL